MAKTSLRNFVEKLRTKKVSRFEHGADPETQVEEYAYDRCAAENTSIADFIDTRIRPRLTLEDGKEIPFEIIDGNYTKPHGRTSMKKLRSTYDD